MIIRIKQEFIAEHILNQEKSMLVLVWIYIEDLPNIII